jgi:hypothetical protein
MTELQVGFWGELQYSIIRDAVPGQAQMHCRKTYLLGTSNQTHTGADRFTGWLCHANLPEKTGP